MKKPPILWTSLEAAVITGGKNTGEWAATGVCLNAHKVRPGDLFFAAQNDDLNEVFRNGAAAAVALHGAPAPEGLPVLRVGDVFEALQLMARAARFKTHAFVVAVQGQEARRNVAGALSALFSIHETERHLSLGMAGMPENCDFAVFGFSPLARPDIAVALDCAKIDASVFDAMPPSGRVLIPAEGPGVMETLARVKAAGIRNVFTFGRSADADATLLSVLAAGNGTRVRIRVLGEIVEAMLPAGQPMRPEILVSALIMKLSEIPAAQIAQVLEARGITQEAVPAESNLALMRKVFGPPVEAAFRVINMIDVGRGQRTAVLGDVFAAGNSFSAGLSKNLDIPRRINELGLLFASKKVSFAPDAAAAIQRNRPAASLEEIATDALTPGDFVTFRGYPGAVNGPAQAAFRFDKPAALRFNPSSIDKRTKADHAL